MGEIAARRAPEVTASQWLRPLPPAVRFVFNGGATARSAAGAAWGCGLPEAACRAVVNGSRAALWMGPDECLLLAGALEEPAAGLLAQLESALTGIGHSLVDVSHRQIALEVGGPHAATILNGACPLDLDLDAFPVGMCTRTVLAKADIVLWRTREDVFHLEVWRSFTGYVTGLLGEIAAEFHPGG